MGTVQSWLAKVRQVHKGGKIVFVDYSGKTVEVFDSKRVVARQAQVFVGGLPTTPASWSQSLPDWWAATRAWWSFFGGVPKAIVPDNVKSAVT